MEYQKAATPEVKRNEFDPGDFVNSLIATIRDVLTKPAEFFAGMPRKAGYGNPFIFGIVMSAASGFLAGLLPIGAPFPGMGTGAGGIGGAIGGLFGGAIGFAIFSFIGAGILHASSLIFADGAKGGFEATWRVGAYSSAVGVGTWVPFVGFILGLYGLYVAIMGIKEVHETTPGKAATAVLVPFVVVLVLVGLMFAAILASFLALR